MYTRLIIASLLVFLASFRQPAKEKVNWMTIEQIEAAYQKEPRPILIDLYTTWCGWCKKMDKVTYTNPDLVKYVNSNFYALKYDAESKADVKFNNTLYRFNPAYKSNDFAVYLSGGRLEFPTTVFLSTPDAQPAPLGGYLTAPELEAPIKYFGEKQSTSQSFESYFKTFKGAWK